MVRLFKLSLIALFASLALSACTPTRTTKSAGEQIDDSTVTARVKTALARELGAGDSIRTDVETFRGKVQLNGFVDSSDKKATAGRVAKTVKGVVSVDNNLVVSDTPRTAGEYIDDKVITGKIKAAFAADSVVAAHQVNVDVRDGVVLLSGFTDTAEQKSRAGEIARKEGGVKDVDNQIAVKQR
jgi:hyperosmotically inducible periplasmic protein